MSSPLILVNQLQQEKSLYLKQHASNPVAWQVWSDATLALAKEVDRPLFVSIGYAACHWCHVMEHESFCHAESAQFLNEHFIPLKLDREERPDIDGIYMRAAELMGVQGGWPLTVFADCAGHPFMIGTYFPPTAKAGLPAFLDLLKGIHQLWKEERGEITLKTKQITTALKDLLKPDGASGQENWTKDLFREDKIFADLHKQYYDKQYGGFKFHPLHKFPPSMVLRLLMRIGLREEDSELITMSEQTLIAMHHGGLYDHLRGGIARYSTDRQWRVPHFEKMLYDNALFIEALLDAFLLSRRGMFLKWAAETAAYLLAEMQNEVGGFMSSQDADSQDGEGYYFTWTYAELEKTLTPVELKLFSRVFVLSERGNFEGRNILTYHEPFVLPEETHLRTANTREQFARICQTLLMLRVKRERPLIDDKIIAGWNGLAISALARLARVLRATGEPTSSTLYANAASTALEFVQEQLFVPAEQKLYRRYVAGERRYDGTLADYTQVAAACLDLYETTFLPRWVAFAQELIVCVLKHFFDQGVFVDQDLRHAPLITRYSELHDGVEPSGQAKLTEVLLRMDACGFSSVLSHRGEQEKTYATIAEDIFVRQKKKLENTSLAYMQKVLHDWCRGFQVVTYNGEERKIQPFIDAATLTYVPQMLFCRGENKGEPSVLLCRGQSCLPRLTTLEEWKKILVEYRLTGCYGGQKFG